MLLFLSSILAILILLLSTLPIGIFLGIICTRFRDVPLIVSSMMQIIFFMSPVLWKAKVLGNRLWVAEINPVFHFLNIIREPLIDNYLNFNSWLFCLTFMGMSWIITIIILALYRSRVPYWI